MDGVGHPLRGLFGDFSWRSRGPDAGREIPLPGKKPDAARAGESLLAFGDPLIRFYLSGLGTWFAHRIASLPEPMQALALGRMYGDPTQLRDGSLGKYIGSLRVPGTSRMC
jgi:hypothetical protein